MTLPRLIGVLLVLGALGLGVAGLRAEQVRCARRIQRIQIEKVTVRRALWSTQLTIAQRKAPEHIGLEVERWALGITAPEERPTDGRHDGRQANAR